MGYEVHITRKSNWSDAQGPAVSLAEWQDLIACDPELREFTEVGEADRGKAACFGESQGALSWSDGEITSKNPDEALVAKMVQIAAALGATAQGDDGEIYAADGTSCPPLTGEPPTTPTLFGRLRSWLRARREAHQLQNSVPSFKVGSQVRDSWGRRGTIVKVDRNAMSGLGELTVRFDDGHEACVAYVASGLKLDGE